MTKKDFLKFVSIAVRDLMNAEGSQKPEKWLSLFSTRIANELDLKIEIVVSEKKKPGKKSDSTND